MQELLSCEARPSLALLSCRFSSDAILYHTPLSVTMTLFHHNDAFELLDDGTTIRYRHGMFSRGEQVEWDELPEPIRDAFAIQLNETYTIPVREEDVDLPTNRPPGPSSIL